MFSRIDRLQTELPPPSDPDPEGAAAVQELLGGRFGEMSTLMNYTYQSFNFRNRQGARPFYDLISNIAAEEFGHIELVAATINTMLTGATPTSNGKAPGKALAGLKGVGNPHHFLAGGQGLNTGLVDAVVLAKTLAEVVSGRRDASFLDEYERLRRPAAVQVLALAGRLTNMATLRSAPRRLLRNTVLEIAGRLPMVRKRLQMSLSGLSRRSAAASGSRSC